jgi:transcriptional regulator with XRE-family HTH domain
VQLLAIVSSNIRYFRKSAGLTQEALAWKSKLSSDFISRLERGEDNISIVSLEKIAKVLNVDPYKLLIPRE